MEINLLQLLRVLKKHGVFCILSTVVGGLLAFAVAANSPSLWEAKTVMQPAQIAYKSVTPTGDTMKSQPIEVPMFTVTHMRDPAFLADVLAQLQKENKKSDFAGKTRLKVSLQKPEDFIQLSALAASPELAEQLVLASTQKIISEQSELVGPELSKLWTESLDIQNNIASIERVIHQLESGHPAARPLSALESAVLSLSKLELASLGRRREAVDQKLDPNLTFPMRAVGPVQTSTNPVAPNKLQATVLGLALGFLLGLVILFVLYRRESR